MSMRVRFEELMETVIEPGICASCGACVVICPYKDVLEYSEGKPKITSECKVCGICSRVCPRYTPSTDEVEKLVFGRAKKIEEDFGVFREIYVTRSTDDKVLKHCQDGGAVTAIITSALDSGIIDGAIISGIDPSVPWFPMPIVTANKSDIIRFSGTRYTYSPNLLALRKCVVEGSLRKIALVGTPCQILAFRRIQKIPLKKFSDRVSFTVGLFCSESFTYSGLMVKKIQNEMGIDLKNVQKINIKGKMLLYLKNGKVVEIPLKEVRTFAEEKCCYCPDFSAELADISVGGIGLDGRTLTVIRTEIGEQLFRQALKRKALDVKPANELTRAYKLLVQLSKSKRRKAQNTVK